MSTLKEKRQTIKTYDRSAKTHAEKFDQIGARINDIKRAFSFISKNNPKVVELGCGNGRDAKEIINLTDDYLGIDLSREMIQLAKENVPGANFQLADIEEFQFPQGVDICFAFASLLHSDKESVKIIIERVHETLNKGGVFFISTKYAPYHKETSDKPGQGPKTYYFYTPEEIISLCPAGFQAEYQDTHNLRGQNWFTLILQKK